MKKYLTPTALLMCIVLLFTACSLPTREYSCGEMTLTLPVDFADVFAGAEDMGDLEFYFANRDIAITGLHESKEEVWGYFPGISTEDYARIVMESLEAEDTLVQRDGLWTFTFLDDVDDAWDTCTVVIHETDTHFWLLQANCRSSQYDAMKDAIWQYLSGATFQ